MCLDKSGYYITQEKEFKYEKGIHSKAIIKIIKDKKQGRIFVYKIEDKIVGMISLLYVMSSALGKKAGILEDVIVLKEFRNLGIGSELMRHALEYADKKSISRITLLTDSNNKKAHKFYEKFGFKKSDMCVFRKQL